MRVIIFSGALCFAIFFHIEIWLDDLIYVFGALTSSVQQSGKLICNIESQKIFQTA